LCNICARRGRKWAIQDRSGRASFTGKRVDPTPGATGRNRGETQWHSEAQWFANGARTKDQVHLRCNMPTIHCSNEKGKRVAPTWCMGGAQKAHGRDITSRYSALLGDIVQRVPRVKRHMAGPYGMCYHAFGETHNPEVQGSNPCGPTRKMTANRLQCGVSIPKSIRAIPDRLGATTSSDATYRVLCHRGSWCGKAGAGAGASPGLAIPLVLPGSL